MTSFDALWSALEPIGRHARTGGYRRFAWTDEDATLRDWFAGEAAARGFDVTTDRAGNQWAWWGDPDADQPGVVVGSHLDSVPDGGAFDGPLGVASAFAALDTLRAHDWQPARPVGVVNFVDEEGARFGIACAGSRLLTGALTAERALALTDNDGTSMAEARARHGLRNDELGRDDDTLRRIGSFVELHVEQGRALVELGRAVGVGGAIWPHGRWRLEIAGEANHAGTTRLGDRRDAMLSLAHIVIAAREAAERHDAVATCGKVLVEPNGVNAIPSHVRAWLDARAASTDAVRAVLTEVAAVVATQGGGVNEESWTERTPFSPDLTARVAGVLRDAPVLDTGAGHDAGILAAAGIASTMVFVRNPTGVSHSPAEHAEPDDCARGVAALATVLEDLAG